MTRNAKFAIVTIAAALALAQPVAAQTRNDRLPVISTDPTPQSVEQKRAMVAVILRDSPVATRIAASANPDARRYFATALELQEQVNVPAAQARRPRAANSKRPGRSSPRRMRSPRPTATPMPTICSSARWR